MVQATVLVTLHAGNCVHSKIRMIGVFKLYKFKKTQAFSGGKITAASKILKSRNH